MRGGLRNQSQVGWCLLAGTIVVAAVLVFWLQRGLTYGYDEFVWLEHGLSDIGQDFHPYGGHLILFPYLVFRAVLEVFGESYLAFTVIQVVGLSIVAVLVYVYGKSRLGPILALVPVVVMLFLGSAWVVLLEPMIGIQFLCAIAPGLGAIVALEREDRRGDIAACVLLCLSLAGFSQGAVFLVGAIVSVAVSRGRRQRAWVVIVPILLYGGWRIWAAQFEGTGIVLSNIPLLPSYFVDALSVFTTAIFGVVFIVGTGPWTLIRLEGYDLSFLSEAVVFTVFEALAVFGAVLTARRRHSVTRRIWPALAMLIALWVELGIILIPGRTAAEPRYLYAGVLLLLLVLIELLRGVKTNRTTLLVAGALTCAVLAGNAARFHEARQKLDVMSHEAKAIMAVVEIAGKHGDQAFTPNIDAQEFATGAVVLNAGPWVQLAERYGSPSYSVAELLAEPAAIRAQADGVSGKDLGLALAPAPTPTAGGCRTVGSNGVAPLEVPLPRGGAVLVPTRTSPAALRRWADAPVIAVGELEAGRPALLRIPPDRAGRVPWKLSVAAGGPLRICPIPAGGESQ